VLETHKDYLSKYSTHPTDTGLLIHIGNKFVFKWLWTDLDLPKEHELRGSIETIRNSGNKAAEIVQDLFNAGDKRGDRRDIHQKVNNFLNKIKLHQLNSLKVHNLNAKIS